MAQQSTPQEISPQLKPPAAVRWVALTSGLAILLVALLMLFILPSLSSGPKNVAVGVIGDAKVVSQLEGAVESESPGAFLFTAVDSAEELTAHITDRSLSGGFDLSDSLTLEIFVASAASPAISGSISAVGQEIAQSLNREVTVTDVVPLPDSDPSGVGIGGLAFPLVFGGIVPVVAYRAVMAGRRGWILTGLVGFSIISGVVVSAVLRFMFGSIEHSFWPVAGAVALGIAALAVPLAGLQELFGGRGFTIGAMTMMFLGNPFAGIATGSAWLPTGVAVLGQLLPPGAAGTLVRAVAYFDGAGGAVAALTLSGWVLLGLVLWFCAPRLKRNTVEGS